MKSQAHPEIPAGDYCYVGGEHYYDENGQYRWRTYHCPHMTTKVVNGVALPWCSLLKAGSVPAEAGSLTDEDKRKLREAWGPMAHTEADLEDAVAEGFYDNVEAARATYNASFETPKEFDLFLLWDSCKECGKNMDYPGTNFEDDRYLGQLRPDYPNSFVELMVTTIIDGKTDEFTVWTIMPKHATPTEKVGHVLRFMRRLPATLEKNCGIKEATISHRIAPGSVPLATNIPAERVAFAHRVIKALDQKPK